MNFQDLTRCILHDYAQQKKKRPLLPLQNSCDCLYRIRLRSFEQEYSLMLTKTHTEFLPVQEKVEAHCPLDNFRPHPLERNVL